MIDRRRGARRSLISKLREGIDVTILRQGTPAGERFSLQLRELLPHCINNLPCWVDFDTNLEEGASNLNSLSVIDEFSTLIQNQDAQVSLIRSDSILAHKGISPDRRASSVDRAHRHLVAFGSLTLDS